MSVLRSPLTHFVALGTLLFAVSQFTAGEPSASEQAVFQLPPGLDANQGRAWVEESVLVEAARSHGLHRADPVVRRRLITNLHFAGLEGDEASLLDQAERLDMVRHDPVVRRRLATRVLATRASEDLGRDATEHAGHDLASWYGIHGEQFRTPPRRDFSHVWIPDIHRSNPSARMPRRLTRTQTRLSAALGPSFAAGVFAAPVGRWSGPVRSPLGEHLIYVHQVFPGAVPPLANVRPAARAHRLADQQRHQRKMTLKALRQHYGVTDVAESQ